MTPSLSSCLGAKMSIIASTKDFLIGEEILLLCKGKPIVFI